MEARTGKRRKPLQWRLECIGHTFLESIAAALPGPMVFRLGEALGSLAWHLLPSRRRIVVRNLRIAMAGEEPPSGIAALAKESFRRTGANLLSVARTAKVPAHRLHEVLLIENPELLHESLAKGRGLVLLLAHMGNWELLSRMVHFFPPGSPAGAFYRPLNNPILDQRVRTRREADGLRTFSKKDNPLHASAFLRAGGSIGILSDQRVGPKGDLAVFFGRTTRCSPLPSLLARRAKSPVVALSLTTTAPGQWRAKFIPVDEPTNTGNCMAALESAMKAGPADVFWFQDRWRTYLRKDRTLEAWIGTKQTKCTKKHRLVIWLVDAPPVWSLPAGWVHPDATYEAVIGKNADPPSGFPRFTRVHRTGPASPRRMLRTIDEADALPVDLVIAPVADSRLAKAAAAESIPLLVLP